MFNRRCFQFKQSFQYILNGHFSEVLLINVYETFIGDHNFTYLILY